jgi:hypothetical protein
LTNLEVNAFFSEETKGSTPLKSSIEKILTRISTKGGGFVFSSNEFLDLGTRGSVDVALSNLTKDGRIRRLARGLYDYSKHSDLLAGPARV